MAPLAWRCLFLAVFLGVLSSARAREDDVYSSDAQYLALKDLFDTTNGLTTWSDRSGWSTLLLDHDYCRPWFGVVCDSSGSHVVGLALSNNGLSGSLPASLSLLTSLRSLDLSSNALQGTIPAAFGGNLAELAYLNFSRNALSGSLPASMGTLASLATLDMSYNNLTEGIPYMRAVPLAFIALQANDLDGLVPDWLACTLGLVCNLGDNPLLQCQSGCLGNQCNVAACLCATPCFTNADCAGGLPGCNDCLNGTCIPLNASPPPPPAPVVIHPPSPPPPPPPSIIPFRPSNGPSPVTSALRTVLVDLAIAVVALVAVAVAILATMRPVWLCGPPTDGSGRAGYTTINDGLDEEVSYDSAGGQGGVVSRRGDHVDSLSEDESAEAVAARRARAKEMLDPRTELIRAAIREHATEVNTRYNSENYYAPAASGKAASRPVSRVRFGEEPRVDTLVLGDDSSVSGTEGVVPVVGGRNGSADGSDDADGLGSGASADRSSDESSVPMPSKVPDAR